mmetsp:Transcript_4173/g.8875  ORF Transcript_4173/g.8875 Transcript_4173/m.8875 type:complete len:155 (-) Transcript_4173:934-1398(-)
MNAGLIASHSNCFRANGHSLNTVANAPRVEEHCMGADNNYIVEAVKVDIGIVAPGLELGDDDIVMTYFELNIGHDCCCAAGQNIQALTDDLLNEAFVCSCRGLRADNNADLVHNVAFDSKFCWALMLLPLNQLRNLADTLEMMDIERRLMLLPC